MEIFPGSREPTYGRWLPAGGGRRPRSSGVSGTTLPPVQGPDVHRCERAAQLGLLLGCPINAARQRVAPRGGKDTRPHPPGR